METTAINHGRHRSASVVPAKDRRRIPSIARIVTIVGALLIEAIVVLGFVVLSLGIGGESHPGFGPDRPPPPPTTAPEPPPDQWRWLALTAVAGEGSSLLAGRGT